MLEKVCTNTTVTHRVRPDENSEIKLGVFPMGIKKETEYNFLTDGANF